MKTHVTEDCIACERCVEICPEVFEMGETFAQVKVDEVPEQQEELVRQAAEECPTAAIIIDE